MEKKYEMFKEKETDTLFRIRALRDFGLVKKGDIGGYVESEFNLSHEGYCWIYGNARVYKNAIVFGHAQVFGLAQVFGYARVEGHARVYDTACVFDYAYIKGDAQVHGNAVIGQRMMVSFSDVTDDLTKNIKMSLRAQCNLLVEDNYVIAYKLVRKDLSSFYDNNFFYRIGEVIEAEDPEDSINSCASGLHFSHLTYWDSHTNLSDCLCLKAKIKLEDIITIQDGKIRCRKAEILGSFEP